MKILFVHNYYGSAAPSGENQVFEDELGLLTRRGHILGEFVRYSDEIRGKYLHGLLIGALATPWNPWSAIAIRRVVDTFSPRIVHVHNTFPLISPSIFSAIGSRAARVLTLHNYRLFCPAAIPMRKGQICIDCLKLRSSWPAFRFGCYRNSHLATLPLAFSVWLNRILGTWSQNVDAFIALSDFQRENMIKAGLPAELVHVKSNFYPGYPAIVPWADRRPSVVFAGRLTPEKGVLTLVRAWILWGSSAPELRIVGDGSLRSELEQLAATAPQVPIRFLGQLKSEEAQAEIAHARMLILPSEWFEGFPMVIREAFAFGTPVAASFIGPLSSIVRSSENGVLFNPANPMSLVAAVRDVWGSQSILKNLAVGARNSFKRLYTEDANYRQLMGIYQNAITVNRERKNIDRSKH